MKRLLCIFLTFCMMLGLTACTKEEKDFPTEVEAIFPTVEGRRIPFKLLSSGETRISANFVLRSKEEVEQAFEQGLIPWQQDSLLRKDFELYQIVGITVSTNSTDMSWGVNKVAELVDTGELTAVYASDRPDEVWGSHDDYIKYLSIVLIRKSDYDFSNCENNFELQIKKKVCYSLYPDRVK